MRSAILLLIVLRCPGLVLAQATDRPAAGIYPDAHSFAQGRPSHQWEELRGEWYLSPEDDYARGIFYTASGEMLTPLVVCREGDCYLLDPDRRDGQVAFFARLIETGPISVYQMRREYAEEIPIKAYNPANGRPFLQGKVPRRREVHYLAMWRHADDQRRILDRHAFQEWTGFDPPGNGKEADLIRGVRMFNQWSRSAEDPMNY